MNLWMRISRLKVIISNNKEEMGGFVYREKPDLTKHSKDGEAPHLRYGSCEMQGWRQNMVRNLHYFLISSSLGRRSSHRREIGARYFYLRCL